MGSFMISPGVETREKDLSQVVTGVSTSYGATVGNFVWGPVNVPTEVSTETELVATFGKPTNTTAPSFFTAANFLAYATSLKVVRAETTMMVNACTTPWVSQVGTISGSSGSGAIVGVTTAFDTNLVVGSVVRFLVGAVLTEHTVTAIATATTMTISPVLAANVAAVSFERWQKFQILSEDAHSSMAATDLDNGGVFAAKYPGSMGNSLSISMADKYSYKKTLAGTIAVTNASATITGTSTAFLTELSVGSKVTYTVTGVEQFGYVTAIASDTSATLDTAAVGAASGLTAVARWAFADAFDGAPGTSDYAAALYDNSDDEMHMVVYDQDGLFSGTPGLVLERFAYVSKASDGLRIDGSTAYYKNVLDRSSKYIWWLAHPSDATGSSMDEAGRQALGSAVSPTVPFYKVTRPIVYNLLGGDESSSTITDAFLMDGYDLLANDEKYDVSLIPVGKVSASVANYVIQNIAEIRKDCVAFISPYDTTSGEFVVGNTDIEVQKLITFRNLLPSSSYSVLDSGAKYQYDRYNDIYRWVPLNGDIAGLCARTDHIADPWFSPGGFNRGNIKNLAKLAINPNRTQRDTLYKANVNCVVNFPGEGPVLYGDKTLQTKPSAFDRINVRRLFIVMEKAIATAAKYQLFELNDSFTRAQFKSMIEPFLRDIQGRRGIIDFQVVCDDSNNTPEVIDRNEFKADIYVKPARSINFIYLTFVAVRTGVTFSEVVGKA